MTRDFSRSKVCKVDDSCDQTLDSFSKFYLFNAWLNESSIMITPTNHHSSTQKFPFQGIYFSSYTSEKALNSSAGESARLSKIAKGNTMNFLSYYIWSITVDFHYRIITCIRT